MTAYFWLLFLGVLTVLLLTSRISDYGIDLLVQVWNRRQPPVGQERRRLEALLASGRRS